MSLPPASAALFARARVIFVLLASLVGVLQAEVFSFNDPAGPQFTAAQRQAQLVTGAGVVPLVVGDAVIFFDRPDRR